jgi:hypothetical protein
MRTYLPNALMSGCIALAVVSGCGQAASAATLHYDWQYAIDRTDDSLFVSNGRPTAGGTEFEIYSMAVKDDPLTNSVWFALNANLPLYGVNTGPNICIIGEEPCYPVTDSNIGWGDLLLDFSGTGNLKSASDASQLYGIRFSPTNDSGALSVGLYSNVTAKSVVVENAGYSNLGNHNSVLTSLDKPQASMGDRAWNNQYFAPYTTPGTHAQPSTHMLNAIATGNKIAELILVDAPALAQAGFEPGFGSPVGSQVFGFRIAKDALPTGDFIATLLAECINDGIALVGRLAAAPPPPPPPKTCPLDPGQVDAEQPTQVIDGAKYFENAASDLWYDPPANMGYRLIIQGEGSFAEILNFPCLVDPGTGESTFPSPFKIEVIAEDGTKKELGVQQPGGTIDIVAVLGSGAKEVIISGVDPDEWGGRPNIDPPAFKLRFDRPNVNFLVTEIPDTNQSTPLKIIPLPVEPIILPALPALPPIVGPVPYPTDPSGKSCK